MMRITLLFGAVLVLACLPATAVAQWLEGFDSYANGSSMHGQGGWKGWDNDPTWTAYVTDVQSRSSPQSVEITGNSDLVHEYCGATFGQWTYTAWQYIPGDYVGGPHPDYGTYFIMQNTYNDLGPYNWSVQIGFDSTTGMLVGDCGAADNVTMPYITDQWVEIRVEIYLDAMTGDPPEQTGWTQVYYNGTLLDDPALPDHPDLGGGYSWTGGVFGQGGGLLNIGSVDLFANGATPVYYDDLSLVPACLGDLDGESSDVDLADLAMLLSSYGLTTGACYDNGDLDFDFDVDLTDLAGLLSMYGTVCP